jgi:hypothetical protein
MAAAGTTWTATTGGAAAGTAATATVTGGAAAAGGTTMTTAAAAARWAHPAAWAAAGGCHGEPSEGRGALHSLHLCTACMPRTFCRPAQGHKKPGYAAPFTALPVHACASLCAGACRGACIIYHMLLAALVTERPTLSACSPSMDEDDHHFVSKYQSLEEVVGKVMEVAQDQNGCRFLQKKFDEGGPASISLVFQVRAAAGPAGAERGVAVEAGSGAQSPCRALGGQRSGTGSNESRGAKKTTG